jgi:two-component system, NtrC family, nitrogen regulation response regulator GlnG
MGKELSTLMAPKILLADDEVDLVVSCARYLEQLGYKCLQAFDADRAIGLLTREEPDLVITDLQLPDSSGLEIANHVRQTRPHLPVILISAYDGPGVADAAYHAGASFYMPKPFSLSDLAKATSSALAKRHVKNDHALSLA